jgi:hypothetical protein
VIAPHGHSSKRQHLGKWALIHLNDEVPGGFISELHKALTERLIVLPVYRGTG